MVVIVIVCSQRRQRSGQEVDQSGEPQQQRQAQMSMSMRTSEYGSVADLPRQSDLYGPSPVPPEEEDGDRVVYSAPPQTLGGSVYSAPPRDMLETETANNSLHQLAY